MSEKCAITRRNQLPGQHFKGRGRDSDYARHLREKQKAKKIYGLLESQFRRYFEEAARLEGVTGLTLLQMLERRLDNVLYITGMAESRSHARKMILQKKVKVNDKLVDRPSFLLTDKDKVAVDKVDSKPKVEEDMPGWINWDSKSKTIEILKTPERDDIKTGINDQLIVEFYSR